MGRPKGGNQNKHQPTSSKTGSAGAAGNGNKTSRNAQSKANAAKNNAKPSRFTPDDDDDLLAPSGCSASSGNNRRRTTVRKNQQSEGQRTAETKADCVRQKPQWGRQLPPRNEPERRSKTARSASSEITKTPQSGQQRTPSCDEEEDHGMTGATDDAEKQDTEENFTPRGPKDGLLNEAEVDPTNCIIESAMDGDDDHKPQDGELGRADTDRVGTTEHVVNHPTNESRDEPDRRRQGVSASVQLQYHSPTDTNQCDVTLTSFEDLFGCLVVQDEEPTESEIGNGSISNKSELSANRKKSRPNKAARRRRRQRLEAERECQSKTAQCVSSENTENVNGQIPQASCALKEAAEDNRMPETTASTQDNESDRVKRETDEHLTPQDEQEHQSKTAPCTSIENTYTPSCGQLQTSSRAPKEAADDNEMVETTASAQDYEGKRDAEGHFRHEDPLTNRATESTTGSNDDRKPHYGELGRADTDRVGTTEHVVNHPTNESRDEPDRRRQRGSGKRQGGKHCDSGRTDDDMFDTANLQQQELCAQTQVPFGLKNMGNTCYFNAVMQTICQTYLLRRLLGTPADCGRNKHVTTALAKFFEGPHLSRPHQCEQQPKKKRKRNKQVLDSGTDGPQLLLATMRERSQRFAEGEEHDGHEFLRHLIGAVKEEEKELHTANGERGQASINNAKELTVVDKVFGGYFLTVFKCDSCKEPYHLFEPFLDVSLPVAFSSNGSQNSKSSKKKKKKKKKAKLSAEKSEELDSPKPRQQSASQTPAGDEYSEAIRRMMLRLGDTNGEQPTRDSVVDSLRCVTRIEQLDEYLCLNCNQDLSTGKQEPLLTAGSKQTIFYSPPAILTIHLKRFKQQTYGLAYVKVNKHIDFAPQLDLSPFCSSLSKRQAERTSFQYSLYGVVVHSGSLQGGHYTAYVKMRNVDVERTKVFLQHEVLDRASLMDRNRLIDLSRKQPEPLKLMDANVDESNSDSDWWYINDEQILRTNVEHVMEQEAYLLFYERTS